MRFPTSFPRRAVPGGTALLALVATMLSGHAEAVPYGTYDLRQIVVKNATGAGGTLNLDLVDRMIQDICTHGANFPPVFDTEVDLQRAALDATGLISTLDVVTEPEAAPRALVFRIGVLASCSHNLNVPGAARHAEGSFRRLLARNERDAGANYQLGKLLGQIGQARQALPYLAAAQQAGIPEAEYALGIAYLFLGERAKALEHLSRYKSTHPEDAHVAELIDTVRSEAAKHGEAK